MEQSAESNILPTKIAISQCSLDSEGCFTVRGWALTGVDSVKIVVLIDDEIVGEADTGVERPDVYKKFPGYDQQNSGYVFTSQWQGLKPGKARVEIYSESELLGAQESDIAFSFVLSASFESLIRDIFYRAVIPGVGIPIQPKDHETISQNPKLSTILCALISQGIGTGCDELAQDLMSKETSTNDESSLYDRALYQCGDPLTVIDLDAILDDEHLFLPLIMLNHSGLMDLLGQHYELPPGIVRFLMKSDLNVYTRVLRKEAPPMRFQTFVQYAKKRLQVHLNNHRAHESLTESLSLERNAFFDLGCLFGLSMVSALQLGYTSVHGCELDTRMFQRGRKIRDAVLEEQDADYQFYESDFDHLDLPNNFYNLMTVVNVLEHTPKLEETIRKIADVLAPGGCCYIFQGSDRSLRHVRKEPHYHLPLLTILPEEIVTRVLMKLGRIQSPENYCVTRWPGYDELLELFEQYGLSCTIPRESMGFWPDIHVSKKEAPEFLEAIIRETESDLLPHLSPEDCVVARQTLSDYVTEVHAALDNDDARSELVYLLADWDITLRKS